MLRILLLMVLVQCFSVTASPRHNPLGGSIAGQPFHYKQMVFGYYGMDKIKRTRAFLILPLEIKDVCQTDYSERLEILNAKAAPWLEVSGDQLPGPDWGQEIPINDKNAYLWTFGTTDPRYRTNIRDFVYVFTGELDKPTIHGYLKTPTKHSNFLEGWFQAVNCYKQ